MNALVSGIAKGAAKLVMGKAIGEYEKRQFSAYLDPGEQITYITSGQGNFGVPGKVSYNATIAVTTKYLRVVSHLDLRSKLNLKMSPKDFSYMATPQTVGVGSLRVGGTDFVLTHKGTRYTFFEMHIGTECKLAKAMASLSGVA